jgi:hypothetical protein
MFGLSEIRLMSYAMKKTMKDLEARLKILGPDAEDRIGISNDLMLCGIIVDKLRDLENEEKAGLAPTDDAPV